MREVTNDDRREGVNRRPTDDLPVRKVLGLRFLERRI